MVPRDPDAAARIRAHHEAMMLAVDQRQEALMAAVRHGEPYRPALAELARYAREEVLRHAAAEEATLYVAATGRPAGRALVAALTAEHGAIRAALERLEGARDVLEAVAAAAALAALFKGHVAKENDVLLPMLLEEPAVDLAGLLQGMEGRLAAPDATADGGCPQTLDPERVGQDPAARTDGTESGEPVGRVGRAGTTSTDLPKPTDPPEGAPELDVRGYPPAQRHPVIFATFHALEPGQAFILVNDHDPKPLYYQFAAEHAGRFEWEYLERGPAAWRVRIGKVASGGQPDAPGTEGPGGLP